ncbi:hypothetical protein ACFTZI_09850 [Streptomyces decoyicus]|uniref:hypothetical protein n=1 Tax=Streptomyces decoyicus TaxID=249567 RepID=UPI00364078CF
MLRVSRSSSALPGPLTNASGVATLNAGLSLLQISASSYTAVATVGGATIQATGNLAPRFPPV